MRLNQVTVPALDIGDSIEFYSGLGLKLIVRNDHYARFELPDGDSTLSVHQARSLPQAQAQGVVIYFECENLDRTVERLRYKGYVFTEGPTDQAWLWREARLLDPAGNVICLYFAGTNRRNPPWRLAGDSAKLPRQ